MSNARSSRDLLSRRNVLRGAGVALALPWLESLQLGEAKAQAQSQLTRFMPIFLPNGAPELWKPQGVGGAWAMSSVLQPLETLKARVTVVSGLENGSVFNADGSSSVEPAHGRQPGAWLTCVDAVAVRQRLGVNEANGISIDQLLAQRIGESSPIGSLQLGLSTVESSCDGQPCSLSRSVSWRDELTPLYKTIDPLEVFNQLTTALGTARDSEETKRRLASRQSVLDAVRESAGVVRPKLSRYDQQRLDAYLESVRNLERRVTMSGQSPTECAAPAAPVFADLSQPGSYRQTTATYNKGAHADLMNDLIVLAFQCNLTRVVSYMLEDENSQYVYDHVPKRTFTAQGSVQTSGVCGEYSGAQHGSSEDYATITWWNVGKVAELCHKLAAITEADGRTVLDNTVVFLGACMHGTDHRCSDLPSVLIGGGGGSLRTDQHADLVNRPLRDLYFTLMNEVFDLGISDFGSLATNTPPKTIVELLV